VDENEKLLIETVQRSKSNQRRIDDLCKQVDAIQNLTISVNELATTMKHMLQEQQKQRDDIDMLRLEPGNNWNNMKQTIITVISSAITGGIITMLASNFMK
jgi:hypothetical protein